MQTPIHIDSRFPHMGTTIFTVMSQLASECGAINLSQGFPDFQAEPALFDAVHRHMEYQRGQGRILVQPRFYFARFFLVDRKLHLLMREAKRIPACVPPAYRR